MTNSKRKFKIILVVADYSAIHPEIKTIDELLNVKSSGEDHEYMYSLNEVIDDVLDLKKRQHLFFQWNRDDSDSVGIIVRME